MAAVFDWNTVSHKVAAYGGESPYRPRPGARSLTSCLSIFYAYRQRRLRTRSPMDQTIEVSMLCMLTRAMGEMSSTYFSLNKIHRVSFEESSNLFL